MTSLSHTVCNDFPPNHLTLKDPEHLCRTMYLSNFRTFMTNVKKHITAVGHLYLRQEQQTRNYTRHVLQCSASHYLPLHCLCASLLVSFHKYLCLIIIFCLTIFIQYQQRSPKTMNYPTLSVIW